MLDEKTTTELVEVDAEALLEKKLEKTRKSREAEKEAAKEPTGDESKPQQERSLTAEEEKDLAYSELEKMGCSRSYVARMKEKHGTVIQNDDVQITMLFEVGCESRPKLCSNEGKARSQQGSCKSSRN